MSKQQYFYGLGRRKQSVVTARVYTDGNAGIEVNGKPLDQHFNHERLQNRVYEPIKLLDKEGDYRVTLRATGGGLNGQADAAVLAISNALVELDPELRSTLKRAGYLMRDPRAKERKKYGLKRARKAPQFTKR